LGVNAQELSKSNNTIGLASHVASVAGNGSTDKQGVALQGLGLRGTSGDLIAIGDSLKDFSHKVSELKSKGAIMADKDIANLVRAKDELSVAGDMLMSKVAPIISQVIEGMEEGWIIVNAAVKGYFLFLLNMWDVVKKKCLDIIEVFKHPIKSAIEAGKSEYNNISKVVNDATDGYIKGGYSGAASAVGKDLKDGVTNSDIGKAATSAADDFVKTMDKGLTELAQEKAALIAARAKARQNKDENDTPPKDKEHEKIYTNALRESGNMLGQSFNNMGQVTSAVDLAKQANALHQKAIAEQQKTNTTLQKMIDMKIFSQPDLWS
jgi:hypothetical protein